MRLQTFATQKGKKKQIRMLIKLTFSPTFPKKGKSTYISAKFLIFQVHINKMGNTDRFSSPSVGLVVCFFFFSGELFLIIHFSLEKYSQSRISLKFQKKKKIKETVLGLIFLRTDNRPIDK